MSSSERRSELFQREEEKIKTNGRSPYDDRPFLFYSSLLCERKG